MKKVLKIGGSILVGLLVVLAITGATTLGRLAHQSKQSISSQTTVINEDITARLFTTALSENTSDPPLSSS